MRLNFVPTHVFRETPQVSFFDAGVKECNGSDVVDILLSEKLQSKIHILRK